jgi:cytoskeletal protein CcmA (bactofilin family)
MSCINTIRNNPDGSCFPLRGDCGSAILLVVSVGALVTLMVFTWVVFSVQRSRVVVDKRDALRARYAAESVVSTAIYGRMVNPPKNPAVPDTLVVVAHAGDSTDTPVDSSLIYADSIHHSEATATLAEEGTYVRVTASGASGKASCAIDALFGQELPDAYRYALILAEQNKPLDIRKGTIMGDITVAQPPLGTVRGKIETGTIASQLPPVAEDRVTRELKKLESKISFPEKSETVLQGSQAFDERSLPERDKSKDMFVNGNVLLKNWSLKTWAIKGGGAIVSSGDIQISGDVAMEGITLIAMGNVIVTDNVRLDKVTVYSQGAIDLEDDARCSGDLYAFQTIEITDRAEVVMPSFAYIRGVESSDPKKSMYGLQLMKESRFSGTLFCAKGATLSVIDRAARFTGLFYSRGFLELKGTVFGCVAAAMLKESFESDRNVLAGGTINRTVLPRNFTVPPAFGRQGDVYRVVSWEETDAFQKGKGE